MFMSCALFLHRWLAILKKETWMFLEVKSENEAAHVPEIEKVLQGKNASAIALGNGNDHEAAQNLQKGFQS